MAWATYFFLAGTDVGETQSWVGRNTDSIPRAARRSNQAGPVRQEERALTCRVWTSAIPIRSQKPPHKLRTLDQTRVVEGDIGIFHLAVLSHER